MARKRSSPAELLGLRSREEEAGLHKSAADASKLLDALDRGAEAGAAAPRREKHACTFFARSLSGAELELAKVLSPEPSGQKLTPTPT